MAFGRRGCPRLAGRTATEMSGKWRLLQNIRQIYRKSNRESWLTAKAAVTTMSMVTRLENSGYLRQSSGQDKLHQQDTKSSLPVVFRDFAAHCTVCLWNGGQAFVTTFVHFSFTRCVRSQNIWRDRPSPFSHSPDSKRTVFLRQR